jgi:hypothetical protein
MMRVRFLRRFLNSFRGSQIDADVRMQMEAHREMVKADLLRQGMNETEAESVARRVVGNEMMIREAARDETGYHVIHEFIQDVSHAIRSLSHARSFAIIAVATIALGIGTNTAVFSVVNAVLLRPLNTRDADQLIRLAFGFPGMLRADSGLSLPQFNVVRERGTGVLDDLSAHRLDVVNVTVQSSSELLPVARVTASFFRLFDAPIMSGRGFNEQEVVPGESTSQFLATDSRCGHSVRPVVLAAGLSYLVANRTK